MIKRIAFILIAAGVLFNSGCISGLTENNKLAPGTYLKKTDIITNGYRRNYRIHIPKNYQKSQAYPMVMVIHGAFSKAEEIERQSGFSTLADEKGFIVMYPEGIGIFGFLQHWNAGHCCGKAAQDKIDDILFLKNAIKNAGTYLNVDISRIYIVGFSNGGMLAYRFASECSKIVAAVSVLAGSIGSDYYETDIRWKISQPDTHVPMLIIHSMTDTHVPYDGGYARKDGKKTRTYLSVNDSVSFWIKNNGCNSTHTTETIYDGKIIMNKWNQCNNGSEVRLYSIRNWPHVWPGEYFGKDKINSDLIGGFEAAPVIWEFFSRHRRNVSFDE